MDRSTHQCFVYTERKNCTVMLCCLASSLPSRATCVSSGPFLDSLFLSHLQVHAIWMKNVGRTQKLISPNPELGLCGWIAQLLPAPFPKVSRRHRFNVVQSLVGFGVLLNKTCILQLLYLSHVMKCVHLYLTVWA